MCNFFESISHAYLYINAIFVLPRLAYMVLPLVVLLAFYDFFLDSVPLVHQV